VPERGSTLPARIIVSNQNNRRLGRPTEERIGKDRSVFDRLLETFAIAEVMKQVDWLAETCRLHHYRDKDQDEVDINVESDGGDVVGIAVKAAATVTAGDFKGLRKLAGASGKDFKLGVVVYDAGRKWHI
jgi:uncharacterized protein